MIGAEGSEIQSQYTPMPMLASSISSSVIETQVNRNTPPKGSSLLSRAFRAVPLLPTNTSPQWILNGMAGKVGDILNGNGSRTEVDEMLTPERMQQIQNCIDTKEEIAAFQSLKGVNLEESPPTYSLHPQNSRKLLTSLDVPLRPTISVVAPHNPQSLNLNNPKNQATYEQHTPQNYILLPSTLYTLTAPLFRQGPIRVMPSVSEPETSPSGKEPTDRIAFQIAICGTTHNDIFEDEWENDEAELDEILTWWQSLGFESYGRMERPDKIIHSNTLRPMALQPTISTMHTFLGGVPRNLEKKEIDEENCLRGFWENEIEEPKVVVKSQEIFPNAQKQALLVGTPLRAMLESSTTLLTQNDHVIPMGFNLEHDLGDFLSWEAHHVQALLHL
jgi:hypothetical protein